MPASGVPAPSATSTSSDSSTTGHGDTSTAAHPRRAGVLVPLFSLRGERSWGCGDIGDLVPFARVCARAGLALVQILPVNATTGLDASPYAGISAFAIDPVYLALDGCADFVAAGGRGALSEAQRGELEILAAARQIDWPRVRALKVAAAQLAFRRFLRDEWEPRTARADELEAFRAAHADWLDDFALFAVLHAKHHTSWIDWPEPLRKRQPAALAEARATYATEVLEQFWMQWQLDQQWHAARAEMARGGVALMGDLPFASSLDSADVWSHPEAFRTDLTIGTPPDMFSEEGQDWGLPAWDWERLARDDFAWMRTRAERAGDLYAAYRVDHVIGIYRTFVRAEKGDRGHFFPAEEAAQIQLGETMLRLFAAAGEVIAEDLGAVPDFLPPSLERLGIPGYRVLRWEKRELWEPKPWPEDVPGGEWIVDADGTRRHVKYLRREIFRLPATWPQVSVATNGTHDTDTSAEWYDGLDAAGRELLATIPGLEVASTHEKFDDEVRDALLGVLYAAPSRLVLVPYQDLLGDRERVNVPGTVTSENWTYRTKATLAQLLADDAAAVRLRRIAERSGRLPGGGA